MTKPQPFLNYMPWHVKQKIADNVDTKTKLSLRLCSKEYKKYVDSAKTIYSSLIFQWIRTARGKQFVNVHLIPTGVSRGPRLEFFPKGDGYRKRNEKAKWEKVVEGEGDYIEGALARLMKTISNPRCIVQSLELEPPNASMVRKRSVVEKINETNRDFLRKLDEHLSTLNHKLKVNEITMKFDGQQDDVEQVLRHLEPGTLKNISLIRPSCLYWGSPERLVLDRIAETEHWKQAEDLHISFYKIELPVHQWSHFRKTTLGFETMSLELLQEIIEAMKRSPKWQICFIICPSLNLPEFQRYIQQFPMHQPVLPSYERRLLATLDTEQHLHIHLSSTRTAIMKSSIYD